MEDPRLRKLGCGACPIDARRRGNGEQRNGPSHLCLSVASRDDQDGFLKTPHAVRLAFDAVEAVEESLLPQKVLHLLSDEVLVLGEDAERVDELEVVRACVRVEFVFRVTAFHDGLYALRVPFPDPIPDDDFALLDGLYVFLKWAHASGVPFLLVFCWSDWSQARAAGIFSSLVGFILMRPSGVKPSVLASSRKIFCCVSMFFSACPFAL